MSWTDFSESFLDSFQSNHVRSELGATNEKGGILAISSAASYEMVLYAEITLTAVVLCTLFIPVRYVGKLITSSAHTGAAYVTTDWMTFAYSLRLFSLGPPRFGIIRQSLRISFWAFCSPWLLPCLWLFLESTPLR